MARSDLLISLVKAGAAGDRSSLTSTVEAIVAEERSKSHHVLADRLHRALQSVPVTSSSELKRAGAAGRDFVIESEPRVTLESLILTLPAHQLSVQLIEEQRRADLLRSQGMQPRHRVLLSGPPGNGKTSLAEAIAEAVAVPLLTVRYDALVGSYLGETNARLARLFEYARTTPCVLFFDEFDAVGKERGDVHETGEIKRVVSFLLMQLDQLPSYVIVVAATNHAELLDRAVWRRFQLRIDMPTPSPDAVALLVERFFAAWPEETGTTPEKVANQLGNTNFAEVFEFCQNIRRRHILAQGGETLKSLLTQELRLWKTRVRPEVDGKPAKTSTLATKLTESGAKKKRRSRADSSKAKP
ncbi:MAG: AAA family ATPase [Hyphomonas sp.]|uniref:AAA family ATPase n=1 Tax=Hyphomonas sp. TaxID=87 RepID=UPI0017C7B0A5|nr:ATP-binding protein [Hyphomonas sp.]MBA3068962.1 AAA family ATPase [Hyphomonas sp.]MBU4061595.1 ATP-binding protein [Alphaproteobacteria bacterium]MBU4163440.1 ATP-binding protein [Alphaproteobacteria bacterium]